ncbi:MAG: hypothetical protein M3Y43_00940 [Pseudomonadota bacterium]|nr:hypothetical protein [Pseudomonadota bacterium]MDQ2703708.1 hypothetical protein [Pseudomonadota bacterium]
MTVIVVLLYLVIGVGCGVIRLSALAVGLIAMVPAIVGAYAASQDGALSMLIAALIPLLVIECAYFVTMLVGARLQDAKPATDAVDPREPAPGDLRLQQKPQVREEP